MVIAELTLPAEPDAVWRHLREPALISRWFGWDYEGLGHEIDVIFLQEARVDDRAHVLDWGDGIQEGDRFELEDLGVETRLRVVRGAPAEGYDDITEGWITFAHQLRFALEHGGRAERRTLHLTRRRAGRRRARRRRSTARALVPHRAPGRRARRRRAARGLGEAAGGYGLHDLQVLRRAAGRGALARLVGELTCARCWRRSRSRRPTRARGRRSRRARSSRSSRARGATGPGPARLQRAPGDRRRRVLPGVRAAARGGRRGGRRGSSSCRCARRSRCSRRSTSRGTPRTSTGLDVRRRGADRVAGGGAGRLRRVAVVAQPSASSSSFVTVFQLRAVPSASQGLAELAGELGLLDAVGVPGVGLAADDRDLLVPEVLRGELGDGVRRRARRRRT